MFGRGIKSCLCTRCWHLRNILPPQAKVCLAWHLKADNKTAFQCNSHHRVLLRCPQLSQLPPHTCHYTLCKGLHATLSQKSPSPLPRDRRGRFHVCLWSTRCSLDVRATQTPLLSTAAGEEAGGGNTTKATSQPTATSKRFINGWNQGHQKGKQGSQRAMMTTVQREYDKTWKEVGHRTYGSVFCLKSVQRESLEGGFTPKHVTFG